MASNRTVAGAAVLLAGALLSVTGIGTLLGIPMVGVGLALLFPRFAAVIIALTVLAIIGVILAL
jgi:hypothetical protein